MCEVVGLGRGVGCVGLGRWGGALAAGVLVNIIYIYIYAKADNLVVQITCNHLNNFCGKFKEIAARS
jgi:glycerol-3-phosphate dehydrogenase